MSWILTKGMRNMNSQSKAPLPKFKITQIIRLLLNGVYKFNIHSHVTGEELYTLHSIAKKLSNGSICVEIGSYIGASSYFIAKGLKNKSKLYCIDAWQNDAMSEGKWDTFQEFCSNTNTVSSIITPIREYSYNAVEYVKEPIDFIFIDGDHSYDGVKRDLLDWIPKVKSGGTIAMHDIGWNCGVTPAINDFLLNKVKNIRKLPNLFWAEKL